jgi:trk system potassium uptake protein TrkH
MRYRAVSRTLGYLLLIFSASFILPVLAGAWFGEGWGSLFEVFVVPALITAATGGVLMLAGKREEELRDRDAFITVAVAWLLISLFGCLPYILSGRLPAFIDAFFESTSGFTTTGASVISAPEMYPSSLLLWRATTALIGGMGIIVLSMIVLSRIVGGSTQLLKAEASVHTSIRIRPSMRQIATTLWAIYLGFIAAEIVLLIIAGMGPFDAVCHSFTTLSTCGFSTRNVGVMSYDPTPWIGTIITVFMILGAMSFTLHFDLITGKFRKLRENPELWAYLGSLAAASIITFSVLYNAHTFSSLGETASHSIFVTTSIMTTTGYHTADFALWPSGSQLLLIFLMIVGGMSGSTAGGVKVIRFIVLLKMVRREIRKVIHPRAIHPITLGGRPLSEETTRNVISYFFIYIALFCIFALALCIAGMRIDEGLASSASAMGGVGPALGRFGPMYSYIDVHWVGKAIMCIAMWMGRLEIYPALLLFSPSAYKR